MVTTNSARAEIPETSSIVITSANAHLFLPTAS